MPESETSIPVDAKAKQREEKSDKASVKFEFSSTAKRLITGMKLETEKRLCKFKSKCGQIKSCIKKTTLVTWPQDLQTALNRARNDQSVKTKPSTLQNIIDT